MMMMLIVILVRMVILTEDSDDCSDYENDYVNDLFVMVVLYCGDD
jgi:hypothetical protein